VAWEWLAPASSLFGVAVGGLLTRMNDVFKSRTERDRQGRDYAAQAMDAVMVLEQELPYTVAPRTRVDQTHEAQVEDALRTLYRVTYYVPDASVREQLQLAHRILNNPEGVSQWSSHDLGMPARVAYSMGQQIKAVLGAYLRQEKTAPWTAKMRQFDEAYDEFIAELAHQEKQHEADRREERRKQRKDAPDADAT
jgi:hypothetical protein